MVDEGMNYTSAAHTHFLCETGHHPFYPSARKGAPDGVTECLLNKEQVAEVPSHITHGDHWHY